MNPVVHFEMPYENREAYEVLSICFQLADTDAGRGNGQNYVLATTTESDENGPKELGCINGGFSNQRLPDTNAYPSFVIAVDDIKESIKKITNAGGNIHDELMDIPGVGVSAWFVDTEGNRCLIYISYDLSRLSMVSNSRIE